MTVASRSVSVPAVVTVHGRVGGDAVFRALMAINRLNHVSPHRRVLGIARKQKGIAKAAQPQLMRVAICNLSRLGNDHRERPAVDTAVPFSFRRAANGTVETNIGWNNIGIRTSSFGPRIYILE